MITVLQNFFDVPGLNRVRTEARNYLIEGIIQEKPDLVLMQEAIWPQTRKMIETNFLKHNYYVSFLTNRLGMTLGGLMIATKQKPRNVNFSQFTDQGSWMGLQVTDRVIGKGCLLVELDNLNIINVHLTTIYNQNSGSQIITRQNQLKQLEQIFTNRKGKIIAGGDFGMADNKVPLWVDWCKRNNLFDQTYKLPPRLQQTNTHVKWQEKISLRTIKSGNYDFILTNYPVQDNKSKTRLINTREIMIQNRLHNLSDHFGIKWELFD